MKGHPDDRLPFSYYHFFFLKLCRSYFHGNQPLTKSHSSLGPLLLEFRMGLKEKFRCITTLPFVFPIFLFGGVINTAVCEETYRASSGTLRSPLNTGGSRQCTFIIEQWPGYVARLQFTDFNLGDGSDNCQNTYLEVGL